MSYGTGEPPAEKAVTGLGGRVAAESKAIWQTVAQKFRDLKFLGPPDPKLRYVPPA